MARLRLAFGVEKSQNKVRRKELLLLSLGSLGAVFGTGLHTVLYALGIQRATDDVVTYTGKVLNTAAANQNNRVLLQVVANAGNIGGNLVTVGQAHTSDFTKRRVGLLGGSGSDCGADTSLLGGSKVSGLILQGVQTLLQSGSGGLVGDLLSALSNELIKSRHDFLLS